MNPNSILLLLAASACPVCMGLMIWWMNKRMNHQADNSLRQKHAGTASYLDLLTQERRRLQMELSEIDQLIELEKAGHESPANVENTAIVVEP